MNPKALSLVLVLATCCLSADAEVFNIDFTELSQSAVITEEDPILFGFPSYYAIATDVLPNGDVFEITAENPEGVAPPSFSPTEIHVRERGGGIVFSPPDASPFMAIEFSAWFTSSFDGSISFRGVDDDYIIRVTTEPRGEIYFGLAENFNGSINGEWATVEMPRQTILRTGPTQIGSFARISTITAYSVQNSAQKILPEPSSGLLLLLAAVFPMMLRRRPEVAAK